MDANEHILTGHFARMVSESVDGISEVSHRYWPRHLPPPHTHIDGKIPIDGIFATSDIDVTNFLSLSCVGDHRTMIVEFTTLSALGQTQGTVVRPTTYYPSLLLGNPHQ